MLLTCQKERLNGILNHFLDQEYQQSNLQYMAVKCEHIEMF